MSHAEKLRTLVLISPVILMAACAQNPATSSIKTTPPPSVSADKILNPLTEETSPTVLTNLPKTEPTGGVSPINDPARLKGLSPVQVREVLGQPGFQRRDAPAEIWQYRGHGCTLDLYIYDLGAGQTVEHWAVRSPARVNDADCFQQLVAQGHLQTGS